VEEWYYCVSGRGVMHLDGVDYDFVPGDICVCRSNGVHGLVNNTDEDLRIIVIYAGPIDEAD
jgi:mannose-6-phosphate isomerase-like protein (cupin superfamily)